MQFSTTPSQVVKPKFYGSMNIQKQLLWCMVWQIPFTKSRPLHREVRTILTIQYKSKFNTKIGRCSIEQLIWKFHYTKMTAVEPFTISEDPYRGTPPRVFLYRPSFFRICITWRIVRWNMLKIGSYITLFENIALMII